MSPPLSSPPYSKNDPANNSFFKKFSKTLRSTFSTAKKDTTPVVEITEEFEKQQLNQTSLLHNQKFSEWESLGTTTQQTIPPPLQASGEQETNWERLGARPREPIVASAPPPPISKEREAYLYLSELAGRLQTYDLGEEEIRRAELAANETNITSTEQTTINCDISRGFFELYGNKNICDIPEEDLLFEVKFVLSFNNRDIPNDADLLEALRAFIITRQIQTPRQLFQLLELKTYYSPLVSPTEAVSKVNTPVRNPTLQQCSTGEKTAPNLTTLGSPITESFNTTQAIVEEVLGEAPTTPAIPNRPIVTYPEFTPPGILPITKPVPNRPNRKVTFSEMSETPSTEQAVFDETYEIELSHLLSVGLSPKNAIASALALAQAAIDEMSSTNTPPQPVGNCTQTPLQTPVLSSTRLPNTTSSGGFLSMGSAILPPSNLTLNQPSKSTNTIPTTAQVKPPVEVNHDQATLKKTLNSLPLTSFFINPEEKERKTRQSQAMQALISVAIFCDKETSGRFDNWIAHLESALDLGDFEEGRKLQLLRSKLYGEAAEEFDTFKLDSPIRSASYKEVKARLMKLFHSTETRSQRSVEFHNMCREPEENMRRYANRMRKAFYLAYPLAGKNDPSTTASREQMLMDRFIEGLQPELQSRLKHKEFGSFEKLIDKAELLAMAMEEAQTRSRIQAVYAAREEGSTNPGLAQIVEALERLNEKIEKKAATHAEELQNSLALMKQQLSQPQVRFSLPNYVQQPQAFRRAAVFCEFHNTWTNHTEENCHTKKSMINDTCHVCHQKGHRAYIGCSMNKNPRPPPPAGQNVGTTTSSGPNPGFGGN